ncbi:MAG: ATPase [Gammaproteobacteria bacterium]|nr:MAG: ATPase [Gammaproteobacteria bacterium]RLA23322.1 MAG: ATPase [Gammaproteobacteria bacterium]
MKNNKPYFIVFGNEKGGTGKSTLAMHVAISIAEQGRKITIIDLDVRQKSIFRYMENRQKFHNGSDIKLPTADYFVIKTSKLDSIKAAQQADQGALLQQLDNLAPDTEFVLIDCPGNNTYLSRLAHALADTLITPINDSFVDFDLLGEVNADNYEVGRLSHYSEMVWESRKLRLVGGKKPLDWIVTRNRLSSLDSRNNRRVHAALTALQKKIMFRYVPGLSERVIYRELFPKGLTLLDMKKVETMGKTQPSHIAARLELRNLVESLNLPEKAS